MTGIITITHGQLNSSTGGSRPFRVLYDQYRNSSKVRPVAYATRGADNTTAHKAVPQLMTFEGRNFDILCGVTAPVIYYWGYIKNSFNRSILLAWNIACLLLLANIVITAILSAPFDFQQIAFSQPNIALFYFPFIWLPCFVVPTALLAHIVNIRKLINHKN